MLAFFHSEGTTHSVMLEFMIRVMLGEMELARRFTSDPDMPSCLGAVFVLMEDSKCCTVAETEC